MERVHHVLHPSDARPRMCASRASHHCGAIWQRVGHFKRNFLRIPIFPQAMGLYVSEWKRLFLNGEIQSTARLSLLPGLATVAALELKITGNDKEIW